MDTLSWYQVGVGRIRYEQLHVVIMYYSYKNELQVDGISENHEPLAINLTFKACQHVIGGGELN